MITLLLLASPLTLFKPLLWVLLFLIVAGLIFWAINKLCAAFGIGDPIKSVVIVIFVVICIIALVYFLLESYGGLP